MHASADFRYFFIHSIIHMLFIAVSIIIAVLLCGTVVSQQLSNDALSAFLSSEELEGFARHGALSCEWVLTNASGRYPHNDTIATSTVLLALDEYTRGSRSMAINLTSANIGGYLTRLPPSAIPRFTTGRSLSMLSYPLTTPSGLLCLEYHIIQGTVNAVVPFKESAELSLMLKIPVPELEKRFHIPFPMPTQHTIEVFGDKGKWAEWATANGFGDYTPRTYHTKADIRFPCIIKIPDGSHGKGVSLIQDKYELLRAIDRIGDHPYVLQESIRGKYEISPNFISYRGKLLAMICPINR